MRFLLTYLKPFKKDIDLRVALYSKKKRELLGNGRSLKAFANGHNYFGFHRTRSGWVYREWAPAADAMYLTGDFNGWNTEDCPMTRCDNGVFEVELKGKNALKVGQRVLMPTFGGQKVKIQKEEYTIVDEESILGIFE